MKKILCSLFVLFFFNFFGHSQTGQLNINRIDLMPNIPAPYEMRNWKDVATQYDAYIFDISKTGEHLPLVGFKESGNNFPELQPILLKTYVGATGSNQAEAINIIPAIVGASLLGIDKSNQQGINWVEKAKDFFNSNNNQNVYLNGYNAFSGNDWWYDLMPNVFFYQLYDLYPTEPGFHDQFISVAEQWLKAVYAMGGKTTPWTIPQMNYRGWYLSSMTGNTESVPEPESAGTIAWLLYNAYKKTGEKKYLEGAQLSLDYLTGLNTNPSYELQLPYGTLTAARLNAEHGTSYPLEKLLNWSFERGDLRGWGTIVGKWDGQDVSGLIGEANDNGDDYAFMMNGYQQAAALVPMLKYDKRYAKAIAKWVLNMANASRLFYPEFLEASKQDDFGWSTTNDPESVIGYEALKENWEGKALYGTGDAKRNGWAATNLALYGSSHVGYLAAIVETTDVEGILKLDINKTDFFGDHAYQAFLLYNPHLTDQQVTLNLGTDAYDVYDAISETDLIIAGSGDVQVQVKAGAVVLLRYLPTGTEKIVLDGKLYGDDHIIDYYYGYDFEPSLRIKSFATKDTLLEYNQQATVYALVEHAGGDVIYNWFVNEDLISTTNEGIFIWTTPEMEGEYQIGVEVISGSLVLKDSLFVEVLKQVPYPPVISSIEHDKKFYISGSEARFIAVVEGASMEEMTYTWSVSAGNLVSEDSLLIWTAPEVAGIYTINAEVANNFELSSVAEMKVLVKNEGEGPAAALAYYPMNINVNDYSGNDFHASNSGTEEATDALGNPASAYQFSSGDDIIFVENESSLNFEDAITLSFWVSAGNAPHEAFILSHGSWEERWKVSITPERRLRWTLKTTEGVVDLDSSFPLANNQFYHVTVVYSGYSMEAYMNGLLDAFSGHSGTIQPTDQPVTFGQKGVDDLRFYLNGVLDEVRIYDQVLNPDEILTLQSLWTEEFVTGNEPMLKPYLTVFPNPSTEGHIGIHYSGYNIREVQLFDRMGERIPILFESTKSTGTIKYDVSLSGLYILKIVTEDGMLVRKVVIDRKL